MLLFQTRAQRSLRVSLGTGVRPAPQELRQKQAAARVELEDRSDATRDARLEA